jgi:hypothetical protein
VALNTTTGIFPFFVGGIASPEAGRRVEIPGPDIASRVDLSSQVGLHHHSLHVTRHRFFAIRTRKMGAHRVGRTQARQGLETAEQAFYKWGAASALKGFRIIPSQQLWPG